MGRSERGSVAVEFGLVLPIIAIMIGGLVSFGFVYGIQLTLDQAAREGARALALGEDPDAAVRVAAVGVPSGLVVAPEGSCDPSDPADVGQPVGVRLTIRVELPVPIADAIPLTAEAVMRCGG